MIESQTGEGLSQAQILREAGGPAELPRNHDQAHKPPGFSYLLMARGLSHYIINVLIHILLQILPK